MKIVYIYKSFAESGGIERVLSDKMNWLVRNTNYDITFITHEQCNRPFIYNLDKRIKCIDLNYRSWDIYNYSIFLRPYFYFKYKRQFKNRIKDILHSEKPDIVVSTMGEYIEHGFLYKLPYKFIVESHTSFDGLQQELVEFVNPKAKRIVKWFNKKRLRNLYNVDLIVSLTNRDAEMWKSLLKSSSPKITNIPNMVTKIPNYIKPYDKREKRIICAGRLCKQKGYDMLIKAWCIIADKYKDWRIDIFGKGKLKNELEQQIERYGVNESMRIHNAIDDIYSEYMNSSFLVLSSHYEGFALVLIEAMSCGLPCVSFNCPYGPLENISHGQNGLLVPPDDVKQLANAIEWMITHEEERNIMSIKARKKAQDYHASIIMPKWVDLFENI